MPNRVGSECSPVATVASSSTTAGLMEIVGLNSPEDFERLAEDAIAKSQVLTQEVVNTRPGPATVH